MGAYIYSISQWTFRECGIENVRCEKKYQKKKKVWETLRKMRSVQQVLIFFATTCGKQKVYEIFIALPDFSATTFSPFIIFFYCWCSLHL